MRDRWWIRVTLLGPVDKIYKWASMFSGPCNIFIFWFTCMIYGLIIPPTLKKHPIICYALYEMLGDIHALQEVNLFDRIYNVQTIYIRNVKVIVTNIYMLYN